MDKADHRSMADSRNKKGSEFNSEPLRIRGAQGRNRTVDTRIFSPLLYRLSYLGGSTKEWY